MMKRLWVLMLPSVSLANFFPGTGCGTDTEIRYSDTIPDNPAERNCLLITNAKEYQDFITLRPRWTYPSTWAACPVDCGGSTTTREAVCKAGDEVVADELCTDAPMVSMECNTHDCEQWSQWSEWSTCTHVCNIGSTGRTRECLFNDLEVITSDSCPGDDEQTLPCNTDPCVTPLYNEWSEWSDCLDGAGEIAYCDGGTYSRSRLCIDIDGVTPTGSENCDPPDTVEEIDVPCNTDACPAPIDCPQEYGFAINDGYTCCKHYQRSTEGSCDGGTITTTDPEECCYGGEMLPCSNFPGICLTHQDNAILCPAVSAARRFDASDIGYYIDNSVSRTKKEALELCADIGGKLPGPITSATIIDTAMTTQLGTTDQAWLGLNSPLPVACVDAACDGLVSWDDGTVYAHVDSVFLSVTFTERAGASGVFIPGAPPALSSNKAGDPLPVTVCQAQCTPHASHCPASRPFAIGGGAYCCKFFTKKDDRIAHPLCDGTPVQATDPVDCCAHDDFVPCENALDGCVDNPVAPTFCPTAPLAHRIGNYGYSYDSNVRSASTGDLYCISTYDGRLPSPKTYEDMTNLHAALDILGHDDLGDSIFVSLKSITGVTDCLNEACTDTDLVWGDGSALEYNSEVYGEVLFEPSSSARCTRLDTSPTFTPELADLSYEECTTPRPTACQTDCMPRPTTCPYSYPFVINSGTHCCKYNKRKLNPTLDPLCDGGNVDVDTPVDCCLKDEVQPCTNAFEGCLDHPLAEEICSAFPSTTRVGDWGFLRISTESKSYWDHAKICFDGVSGMLPMLKTEKDIQAVSEVGGDINTWVAMQKAENIECSDSDCEGADISWEDGMPFVFDDGVTYQSMNLDMSERCVYMNLNPASHREGSYQDLMCGDVQMALCAAPCHGAPSKCPTTHPFAINNGLDCCSTYKKIDDTGVDSACDGTIFQKSDPVACCIDSLACTDTDDRGCISQYNANEICPGQPDAMRNGDIGYILGSTDLNKADAQAFCTDNYGGSLLKLKIATDIDFVLNAVHQQLGGMGNVWLGLENVNEVTCNNAECDGQLTWDDGTLYEHQDGIETVMTESKLCAYLEFNLENIRQSHFYQFTCTATRLPLCEVSCAP